MPRGAPQEKDILARTTVIPDRRGGNGSSVPEKAAPEESAAQEIPKIPEEPQALFNARLAYMEARKAARNELTMRKKAKGTSRENLRITGEAYQELLKSYRMEILTESINELRQNGVKGDHARVALQEKALSLLGEEDKRFDAFAGELDKGIWTKFTNRWQRHPGARMAIGAGLSISGFLTGGAGILAARAVWSGTGAMVGVEGAIERYSKTLGQKGLVDELYVKAKYPHGKMIRSQVGSIVDTDRPTSEPDMLSTSGALDHVSHEDVTQEMARLRMLRELKGISLESAGRKGETTAVVVRELKREEERVRREKIKERLEANPDRASSRVIVGLELLDFMQEESKAMESLIEDENDRERVKSIKRKAVAVAAGLTVGMFVGRKGLGKLADRLFGGAEAAEISPTTGVGEAEHLGRPSPSAAFGRGQLPGRIFPFKSPLPAESSIGVRGVPIPEEIAGSVGVTDTLPKGIHIADVNGPDPGIPRMQIPEASEIPARPIPEDASKIHINLRSSVPFSEKVVDLRGGDVAVEGVGAVVAQPETYTETAERGDSVWRMAGRVLEKRYGDEFAGLSDAQRRYAIDAIKDKIVAHPDQFGLKNPELIQVGQEIDFKHAFEDSDEILGRAKGLSKEAQESIMSYRADTTPEIPAAHPVVAPEKISIHEQLPSMEEPSGLGEELASEKPGGIDMGVMERAHEEMSAVNEAVEAARTAPIELTGYRGWRVKHWVEVLIKEWDKVFTKDAVREPWLFGLDAEKAMGSRGSLEKFIANLPTQDGAPTSVAETKRIAKIFHNLFEHLPEASLKGRNVGDVLLSLRNKGLPLFE